MRRVEGLDGGSEKVGPSMRVYGGIRICRTPRVLRLTKNRLATARPSHTTETFSIFPPDAASNHHASWNNVGATSVALTQPFSASVSRLDILLKSFIQAAYLIHAHSRDSLAGMVQLSGIAQRSGVDATLCAGTESAMLTQGSRMILVTYQKRLILHRCSAIDHAGLSR